MLVFVEGGKPENQEKNPRNKDENQHMTPGPGIEPGGGKGREKGGECCHHCATPAPRILLIQLFFCSEV